MPKPVPQSIPRYRLTRHKPTSARGGSDTLQASVVEVPDDQPLPAGAEPVDASTPLSGWEDITAASAAAGEQGQE
jgi:hypothetical protein